MALCHIRNNKLKEREKYRLKYQYDLLQEVFPNLSRAAIRMRMARFGYSNTVEDMWRFVKTSKPL